MQAKMKLILQCRSEIHFNPLYFILHPSLSKQKDRIDFGRSVTLDSQKTTFLFINSSGLLKEKAYVSIYWSGNFRESLVFRLHIIESIQYQVLRKINFFFDSVR